MASRNQPDLFAPLNSSSGAPVAQVAQKNTTGGGLRHCAIGGSASGANPAKAVCGAAVSPPERSGAPRGLSDHQRLERVREGLRDASVRRAQLEPAADAHAGSLKSARERLKELHEEHPVIITTTARQRCLALHDEILAASIKWGKQAREYREITGIISKLTKELADLTTQKESQS